MTTRVTTPDILGNMLTGNKAEPELVHLNSIKTNGSTQMRAGLNADTVAEYREAMQENGWSDFPPIVTFYDGSIHWLADGFHRLAAWQSVGVSVGDSKVPAIVKTGGQRDAVLYAASANAVHGLRRTNADKRRAVEVLLRDEEWRQWSNYEIAKRCAVDEKTVRTIRNEMYPPATEIPQLNTRIGGDGKVYDTTNIGTNRPAPLVPPVPPANDFAPVWQLENMVRIAWLRRNPDKNAALDNQLAQEARANAAAKSGRFWDECKAAMESSKVKGYRIADLQQAINNVISQITWRPPGTGQRLPVAPTPTTQPAAQPVSANIRARVWTWLYAQAGGDYKRLVEIAERLHAQEASHPQWFQMYPAGERHATVIQALEECIDEAAAQVPEFAGGPKPLQEDVQAAVDARMRQYEIDGVRDDLNTALKALERFGDLTGKHTETLLAGRELRRLLAMLDAEGGDASQ
jgi:hypothetical protein